MRLFSRSHVMVAVAIAALVLAAAPVGATGAGSSGCINVKASLNGEGVFIWTGLGDAVGVVVGTGPEGTGVGTFGVIVFPSLCASDHAVEALLTNVESRAETTSSSADPTDRIPVLP